jgi:hypothetical protein
MPNKPHPPATIEEERGEHYWLAHILQTAEFGLGEKRSLNSLRNCDKNQNVNLSL